MGEKIPRRANQLLLDAEQLDSNASKARSLNKRAKNRLLLAKGSLDGQKETNMNSLKHEMKQLKHELREVKQSSGYIMTSQGHIVSPAKRKVQKEAKTYKSRLKGSISLRKKQNTEFGFHEEQDLFNQNEEQRMEIQKSNVALPCLQSSTSRVRPDTNSKKVIFSKSSNSRDTCCEIPTKHNRKVNFKYRDCHANSPTCTKVDHEMTAQYERANTDSRQSLTPEISISVPLESMGIGKKDKQDDTKSLLKSRRISKAENSLAALSVDAAKDRIQNRLSASIIASQAEQGQDDIDSSAYLYAPPDGLPRTVYLLPPLEELFQEAKKARYIRKPRKLKEERAIDDPERELGIDEIFGKAKY